MQRRRLFKRRIRLDLASPSLRLPPDVKTALPASSAVAQLPQRRLIVAITGATGAIYGVRLLDMLRRLGGVETHLLVSAAGWLNIQHELQLSKADLHARADVVHSVRDVGATIASGSFATDGMVIEV